MSVSHLSEPWNGLTKRNWDVSDVTTRLPLLWHVKCLMCQNGSWPFIEYSKKKKKAGYQSGFLIVKLPNSTSPSPLGVAAQDLLQPQIRFPLYLIFLLNVWKNCWSQVQCFYERQLTIVQFETGSSRRVLLLLLFDTVTHFLVLKNIHWYSVKHGMRKT